MKQLIAVIGISLLAFTSKADEEKIVPSEITNVTVYAQGAQVYQTASYSIGKGVTQVVIEGISQYIDPNSLQVKATGSVVLLDSKYSLFYPKPESIQLNTLPASIRKSISLLEDSLRTLGYDLQEIQDEIDVLTTSKSILTNNGAVRGSGKVNDSIALLKEAMEFYAIKMNDINKKLLALAKRKNVKVALQTEMNQRLADLRNYQNNPGLKPAPKGPSHRITITLSANDYAKGKLDISYLVSQAGWTPLYDLRSESTSGTINLNYKAQVYQNTGVDWDNVKLSISTNNPYQNKTKPELHPWYVDFYANNYQTRGGAQNGMLKKSESLGYAQPAPTQAYNNADYEKDALTSSDFMQVIDHMISAEFRIDLPYTIKSDNQQHMVLVKNVDLQAEFKYYTVPKFDNGAYLVAQLSKLDELQLVPAKANIFFDGTYMGETYLDPTTMDDTLNLSLGKDPNIIVKRTLLKKELKEKIVGTKKERTFAYAIEVKNLKSRSIEVIVQDQLPITQNSEIEIQAIDLDKGTIDERTGIIEWKFTLKPSASKDILFKYGVKHDKDKPLSL